MSLTTLTVDQLRCLEHANLELHPGHNLIWGGNASGKTSLLEAIFLLGRGRSFRTRHSERLIRHGQHQLVVFGRTDDPPQTLGIQISRPEGTVAKIGGVYAQSLAELSQAFPVQAIEPGIHRLVEEGAPRRRRWMDWAVFHVEPSFIDPWSGYTRSLRQRNAALKSQPDLAMAWDPELIKLGESIAESRRQVIEQLQPYWRDSVQALLKVDIELSYFKGWSAESTLAGALSASKDRDVRRGTTHVGPHRADIVLKLNAKPARDVLSRGQQKLVGIAMVLSQLRLVQELVGTVPTLLLDDPAAELDREHLALFSEQVRALGCQSIVTALSADLDPLGAPDRVFHVEQGGIQVV